MASPSQPISVAIIGGGIAGLALAAALIKQPHLDVHVYESVQEYKDVGSGLALHRNAIQAMTLLGPEVAQAYFDRAINMAEEADEEICTPVILGHGPHAGELVAELGKAKGRKSISRAELLAGFLSLIPKDRISFGKRVVRIHDPVPSKSNRYPKIRFTFADGTAATADCLLGADEAGRVFEALKAREAERAEARARVLTEMLRMYAGDGEGEFKTVVSEEEVEGVDLDG